MRTFWYFRQLPPLLRVLGVLGMILLLASIAIMGAQVLLAVASLRALLNNTQTTPTTVQPPYFPRWLTVGMAIGMLGSACAWPVTTYAIRFRHPSRLAPRLESWRTQIGATLALAALPLCSLAIATLSVLTSSSIIVSAAFFMASAALCVFAAMALLAASIWAVAYTYLG